MQFRDSKIQSFLLIFAFVATLTSVGLFGVNKAEAAPNLTINYQGKMTDNLGVTLADGNYTFVFSLYTGASGGSNVWTETQTVTITNGLFSTMLGSVTPFTDNLFNQTLYLGVKVGADPEMTPRKIIGSVPSALEAEKLNGLAAVSFLRSDIANATGTINNFNNTNATSSNLNVSNLLTVEGDLTVLGDSNLATTTTGNLTAGSTLYVKNGQVGVGFDPAVLLGTVFGTNKTWTETTGQLASNYFNSTFSPTGASDAFQTGLYNVVTADGSNNQLILVGQTVSSVYGGTANLAYLQGASISSDLANTGSITSASAVSGQINNGLDSNGGNITDAAVFSAKTSLGDSAGVVTNAANFDSRFTVQSGSIVNAYGAYLANPWLPGSGTITNLYGLYVQDQTKGSNLNYNIYSAGATSKNYLEGNLTVGGNATATSFALNNEKFTNWVGSNLYNNNGILGVTTTPTFSSLTVNGNATATSFALNNQTFTNWLGSNLYNSNGTLGVTTTPSFSGLTATYATTTNLNAGYLNVSGGTQTVVGGTNISLPAVKGLSVNEKIVGNYLYMVFMSPTSTDQLRIVDISDPTNPKVVGGQNLSLPVYGARWIDVVGKYAYIGFENNPYGFRIVDISDPTNPFIVGGDKLQFGSSIRGVKVVGKYAYLARYTPNGFSIASLIILDISDPYDPKVVSPDTIPGLVSEARSIDVVGKYAYLVSYFNDPLDPGNTGPNVLRIVDISNPANPVVVGGSSLVLPDYARQVQVVGRYAYVIFDSFGSVEGIDQGLRQNEAFRILDISDPTNPVVVGGDNLNFSTGLVSGGGLRSLYVADGLAYTTEGNGVLHVIDVSSSTNPVSRSQFLLEKSPGYSLAIWALAVSGNYAYVGTPDTPFSSNSTNVLRVVDLKGLKTGTANIGTLKIGSLNAESDIVTARDIFANGLNLGVGGIITDGSISVIGTTTSSFFGGNLGLGTTTPAYTLVVGNGSTTDTARSIQVAYGGICVDDDGWCNATAGVISAVSYTTGHADLAENYQAFEDNLEAGDIVSVTNENNSTATKLGDTFGIKKANQKTDIIGIVSTAPGVLLGSPNGEANTKKLPVALSGRVPLKVNLEGGDINFGDPITLSSIPGIGMKATSSTETIGTALTSFDANSTQTEPGIGQITVFVNLGYSHIDNQISQGKINATNFWSLDETTGQIKVLAPLDLSGLDIKNVKSITSASGNWSISDDGMLVVKKIETDEITTETGVTVKDKMSGGYNCIYVEGGQMKNKVGSCVEPVLAPISNGNNQNETVNASSSDSSGGQGQDNGSTTPPVESPTSTTPPESVVPPVSETPPAPVEAPASEPVVPGP